MNPDAARARIILDTVFLLIDDYRSQTPGMRILKSLSLPVGIKSESDGIEWITGDGPLLNLVFSSLDELSAKPRLEWKPGGALAVAVNSLALCLAATASLPIIPRITKRSKELRARLMLNAVSYMMGSVAAFDREVYGIIQDVENDVVQFGIEPEGPYFHIVMNPDEFRIRQTGHHAPGAQILFKDLATFDSVVSGSLNPMAAYKDGRIFIEGESALALMAGVLMNRTIEYLVPGYRLELS